jgi:hypothetical protein
MVYSHDGSEKACLQTFSIRFTIIRQKYDASIKNKVFKSIALEGFANTQGVKGRGCSSFFLQVKTDVL